MKVIYVRGREVCDKIWLEEHLKPERTYIRPGKSPAERKDWVDSKRV